MIDYLISRKGEQSARVIKDGLMFRYIFGATGVFINAVREGLMVRFPIAECEIRGLHEEETFISLGPGKVPLEITEQIFSLAKAACINKGEPIEWMCYLHHDADGWRMEIPEQEATESSVRPLDGNAGKGCLIDIHSHNRIPAFWSEKDDKDEQGFKLYTVIGKIFVKPTLRVRVGCYGYFYELDANEIFELPEWVNQDREDEQ